MTRAEPNFGHHFASGPGFHLDGWGDGPLLIRHAGREWWFEFSEMWGPTWLRKSDKEPSDRQPTREDDPFWKPFTAWRDGGSRCRAIRTKRPGPDGKRLIKFWLCHVPEDQGEGWACIHCRAALASNDALCKCPGAKKARGDT